MAGDLPNVIPGEPVESAWGNDIRDRVTSRFADRTQRDVAIAVPQLGQIVYIEDPGEVEIWTGADWIPILLSDGTTNATGYLTIVSTTSFRAFRNTRDFGGGDEATSEIGVSQDGDVIIRLRDETLTEIARFTLGEDAAILDTDLEMDGGNIEFPNLDTGIRFVDAYIVRDPGGAMKFVHPTAGRSFRFYSGGPDQSDQVAFIGDSGIHVGPDATASARINKGVADGAAAYAFSTATGSGLGKHLLGCGLYGAGILGISIDNNGRPYMPAMGAGSFPDVVYRRASDGLLTFGSAAALTQPLQDQIDALEATIVALQAQVDSL